MATSTRRRGAGALTPRRAPQQQDGAYLSRNKSTPRPPFPTVVQNLTEGRSITSRPSFHTQDKRNSQRTHVLLLFLFRHGSRRTHACCISRETNHFVAGKKPANTKRLSSKSCRDALGAAGLDAVDVVQGRAVFRAEVAAVLHLLAQSGEAVHLLLRVRYDRNKGNKKERQRTQGRERGGDKRISRVDTRGTNALYSM